MPHPLPASAARRLFALVLCWDLGLLAVSAALELTWRFRSAPEALKQLFRSSSEVSLITWTSVVGMYSAGLACLLLGARSRLRGWTFSGLLLIYLSMDDGAMLHERLADLIGSKPDGVYNWVIYVMPVLALMGLAAFAQMWRASKTTPVVRLGILLAFGMWAGALGCEILERPLKLTGSLLRGFSSHRYLMFVEEALELLAPQVMLFCVLALLGELNRLRVSEWRDRAGLLDSARHPQAGQREVA